jgi:DNA-binding beta-propeller fold protein YncE
MVVGLPRRVLAVAACLSALSACAAPSPLRSSPAPVLGFGGTAPYVSLAPPSRATTPPAADLSPAVRHLRPRVYVATARAVHVIDPRTDRIVGSVPAGRRPRFVIPSWDLTTLWVNHRHGLVPIDPRTGRGGRTLPVPAADLLFTPNGRHALAVVDRRIDVRDPHTMRLRRSIPLPCTLTGADFTTDGSLVAACARHVIRVDLGRAKVTHRQLSPRARPSDVKLSTDGTLYVSDIARGGVWTVDVHHLRPTAFIPTGTGAYGLIPGRDVIYVTNRTEGTISVIDLTTHRVIRRWHLPGDSAPRLGSVSADGGVLWLSDRRHNLVYAVSTTTGRLIRTIRVGRRPYGVCVFPQPGRHSLGHTYR